MPDGTEPKAAPRTKVRYYRLRNALAEKARGAAVGGGGISVEALQAAEAEFRRMSEDYPDWVQSHLKKLYALHHECEIQPEGRAQTFRRLHEMAHDMKGQGGTFGYPLVSRFADSLYQFTARRETYSDNQVEVVKAHVDAMNAVIRDRINGEGGQIGQELTLGLQQAIAKYRD